MVRWQRPVSDKPYSHINALCRSWLECFPWTTSNCYQSIWQQAEQQSRFKVTDERKRGSSYRGWRRGRRCSHRTVTHPHGRQHRYMYVIYREDARLLFSGHLSLQVRLFWLPGCIWCFTAENGKGSWFLLPHTPQLYFVTKCLSPPLNLSISH